MAAAAAIGVICRIAGIVTGHETGTDEIGDSAAHIGPPDREDLLLDCLIDALAIGLGIPRQVAGK